MRRIAIGMIAVCLLTGAAAIHIFDFAAGDSAIENAFWRIGVVMAILWIALPELARVRGKFLWIALAAAVGVLALRPKFAPLVLLFCAAYAILRVRWR